jgi:hypothetical protein
VTEVTFIYKHQSNVGYSAEFIIPQTQDSFNNFGQQQGYYPSITGRFQSLKDFLMKQRTGFDLFLRQDSASL